MWGGNLLTLLFCVAYTSVAGQVATTAAAGATTAAGAAAGTTAAAIKPVEDSPSRWVVAQTTLPAGFQGPGSVAVDDTANVFVVNEDRKGIVRVNSHDDSVTTIMDQAQVRLLYPTGTNSYDLKLVTIAPKDIALAPNEGIYFSDMLHNSIFKITRSGLISRIAGTGEAGFVDGRALESKFNQPRGIGLDASNNVIIADSGNHCIRLLDLKAGALSTLAGQCGNAGANDGFQSGWSTLDTPASLAVDGDGKVFFADRTGLRVIADGNVTTLMPGVRAGALKVYKKSLFIADTYNRCIREVSTDSPHENWQFAGRCEVSYTPGVNTAKTAADDPNVMFEFPVGVAVSPGGEIVYVGDADAGKVYKLYRKTPEPAPLTSELLAQMAADIEALKAKVGL
jgi:DNA-binding beta-propeller fold protein YncE